MTREELKEVPASPIIYELTNPKGRVYVGQTKNGKNRYRAYLRDEWLKNDKIQSKIARSFRKYGSEAHSFRIIQEVDVCDLESCEEFWIDKLDSMKNGLNTINRNYTIFEFKSDRETLWTDERKKNQANIIKQRHKEGCYKDRDYTKIIEINGIKNGEVSAWDTENKKIVRITKDEFDSNEIFVGVTATQSPFKGKKKKPLRHNPTGKVFKGVKDCMKELGKSASFVYFRINTGEFEYCDCG